MIVSSNNSFAARLGKTNYEFVAKFDGGRRIAPSQVYRTLAVAFDWFANEKYNKNLEYTIRPPNFYNVQVYADNRGKSGKKYDKELAGWLFESIAFWMRDAGKFEEFNIELYNRGMGMGVGYVRLTDASTSSVFNMSGPNSPGTIAINNTDDDTTFGGRPNRESISEAAVSRRDDDDRDLHPGVLAARGSTPHTFRPEIDSVITSGSVIGGDLSVELDLMSCAMGLGRQLIMLQREGDYVAKIPPDHSSMNVTPSQGYELVFGREVAESLVDFVEWEYKQKAQSGAFHEATVATRRSVRQRRATTSVMKVKWIDGPVKRLAKGNWDT